jgi:NhaP-type Na+/H+ or K+/H+ antiporter
MLVQAGLSKRLRTLVDSEALLNDGTAFTLFLVLKGFAEGQQLSVADTVRYRAVESQTTAMGLSRDLLCSVCLVYACCSDTLADTSAIPLLFEPLL